METEQGKEIQVLYNVADASWTPHARAVSNIVLFEKDVVKTIFDISNQRFVSLYAAKTNFANEGTLEEILGSFSEKEKDIPKKWFISVPKTLLTPSVLFEDKMQQELLSNQQKIREDEFVNHFPLKRLDAQLIFAYSGIYEKFKMNPNFKINELIPLDAAWLECLYLSNKSRSGLHAHINVNDGYISLAVFNDSTLQFYNTFIALTAEEILYFVMFVSEQLRLNPQRDPYYYSGFVKKGDETLTLLTKYIKFLKPEDRPAQYSYCMPMLDVPGHIFYTTYCTPICE